MALAAVLGLAVTLKMALVRLSPTRVLAAATAVLLRLLPVRVLRLSLTTITGRVLLVAVEAVAYRLAVLSLPALLVVPRSI